MRSGDCSDIDFRLSLDSKNSPARLEGREAHPRVSSKDVMAKSIQWTSMVCLAENDQHKCWFPHIPMWTCDFFTASNVIIIGYPLGGVIQDSWEKTTQYSSMIIQRVCIILHHVASYFSCFSLLILDLSHISPDMTSIPFSDGPSLFTPGLSTRTKYRPAAPLHRPAKVVEELSRKMDL